MPLPRNILIINMGSTSTKLAVFRERECVFEVDLPYDGSGSPLDQLPERREQVYRTLSEQSVDWHNLDLIVARGGLTKPIPAGVYRINRQMCQEMMAEKLSEHASFLGPVIAFEMARDAGVPAITVDPPSTDEFDRISRYSGIPDIPRKSAFHALSQKAAARAAARQLGIGYEEGNFVVAHLGGGITVGAHCRGRVVDCTHGLSEGPFTPERAGSLPTLELVELCYSTPKEVVRKKLVGGGGLVAYTGTKDAREIEKKIKEGDREAREVYEAMACQIAKEIGAMSTVLKGQVDAVVLTGGLAQSAILVQWIKERVSFIAPLIIALKTEMEALLEGGLRVLDGEEEVREYS